MPNEVKLDTFFFKKNGPLGTPVGRVISIDGIAFTVLANDIPIRDVYIL